MGLLADVILTLHFFYFLFCVGGEILILFVALRERYRFLPGASAAGRNRESRCSRRIRHRGFRIAHLAAVGIVGIEGIVGVLCPLTVWEYALRRAAGQAVEEEIPLVPRIIRALLFYDFPFWVFTLLYVGFAVLVAVTYILVPPVKKSTGRESPPEGQSDTAAGQPGDSRQSGS
jgi:hypothetical protein